MFDDILGSDKIIEEESNIVRSESTSAEAIFNFPDPPGSSGKRSKLIDLFDLLRKAGSPSPNVKRDVLRTFYQHLENRNAMDKEKEESIRVA